MVQSPLAGPEPLEVLVVDESPVARLGLCRAVEILGHSAAQARDIDQATAILGGHPADVVLVAWPMPDAPALELVRRVRAAEALDGAPYTCMVLVVTPSTHAAAPAALAAGADAVLDTPVDDVALHSVLHQAGRLARLERLAAVQGGRLAAQEELLREEVRTDPVSRLGNRIRLDEDLRRIRGRAQRYGHRASAVLVAIDWFRRYNEVAGRAAGDEVLRKLARAIRSCLRDADTAYRYAGEEFLVLLPEQGEDGGVVVAERIRNAVTALRLAHPRSDAASVVTVSAGVAELLGTGRDGIDEWLRSAEQALDAAKAGGRNGVARADHTRIAGKDATA